MHSPALAIGWQLWRRHRWGACAALAGLLGLIALSNLQLVRPEWRSGTVMRPLGALAILSIFVYALGVFSLAFEVQMAERQSGYPARSFVLPVRTRTLVAWPMLYGIVTVGLVWVIYARFVLQPDGIAAPLLWPAFLMAAFLAWTQAIAWTPFPLSWLRFLAIIVALTALGLISSIVTALDQREPDAAGLIPRENATLASNELVVTGLLGAALVAAYGTALRGVQRGRRGDVPDWAAPFRRLWDAVGRKAPARAPFSTPAQAQLWCEWRRSGWGFPFFVGLFLLLVLPCVPLLDRFLEDLVTSEQIPLANLGVDVVVALALLGLVLVLPLFFATAMGSGLDKTRPKDTDLSAFYLARPQTSANLVALKFKAAARSVTAGWMVLLLMAPAGLLLAGEGGRFAAAWDRLLLAYPAPRAYVLAAFVPVALLALFWKLLVENLFLSLTGRRWVINTWNSAIISPPLVALAGFGFWAKNYPEEFGRFWAVLLAEPFAGAPPLAACLLGVVVLVKLLGAAWAMRALIHRGLVAPGTLARLAGLWLLIFCVLFGLLTWLVPAPFLSYWYVGCGVALLLPLFRPSLAPLALEWGRHR
jgi:hypothetical protein